MSKLNNNKTAIIVENNADLRSLIQVLLQTIGFETIGLKQEEVISGAVDIKELLKTNKGSTVLFDISPPVDKYFDIYKELRNCKEGRENKFIIMTTFKDAVEQLKKQNRFEENILEKPFDYDEFVSCVLGENHRVRGEKEF